MVEMLFINVIHQYIKVNNKYMRDHEKYASVLFKLTWKAILSKLNFCAIIHFVVHNFQKMVSPFSLVFLHH